MSEPLHDEVLDGLPVLPDEPSGAIFPASTSRALVGPVTSQVQTAAAAAAGGFVAGAALLGLVHRRHNKRAALASARAPRRVGRVSKRSKAVGQIVEVAATRSFLVDVHLLGSPGRHR